MPAPALTALTLAPLLPLLVFVVVVVRMIQHMDELQQRISLESMFIAFVGSLTVAFVFGGLEQAGVWRPPWNVIGTVMMSMWALAYLYTSWKYR